MRENKKYEQQNRKEETKTSRTRDRVSDRQLETTRDLFLYVLSDSVSSDMKKERQGEGESE